MMWVGIKEAFKTAGGLFSQPRGKCSKNLPDEQNHNYFAKVQWKNTHFYVEANLSWHFTFQKHESPNAELSFHSGFTGEEQQTTFLFRGISINMCWNNNNDRNKSAYYITVAWVVRKKMKSSQICMRKTKIWKKKSAVELLLSGEPSPFSRSKSTNMLVKTVWRAHLTGYRLTSAVSPQLWFTLCN